MTNPTYAQNIPGKGRWYVHPQTGEMWPSVTNVLDTAVSKPALVPWAAKAVAEKAMRELPLITASMLVKPCSPKRVADECGKCKTCRLKQLKREPGFVKDTAADLGSRIHDWADGHVLGRPMVHDPEVEPFGKQLLRFFDDFGVDLDKDVEATEATIVNRKVGYAGTGDLWVRLRVEGWARKRLVLVDYKSSSTRPTVSAYPENGMQLAALANGETLLLDDGTEVPAPAGIKDVFVLTLRANDYALIPMPLTGTLDAAFDGFQGALRAASHLHAQYGAKPVAVQPVRAVKAVA
ncbi:MAG: hypothetical protein JWP31_1806 [Aeromicrobium sp.]|nr:hypothetical protein [Aeromicrobium sp.]